MEDKLTALKQHVTEAAANPNFVHAAWFTKWHLEIVEKIATELVQKYPEADADLVTVMAWLHDYGKILDFDNQYTKTLTAGREILMGLDFEPGFIDRTIDYIEILDKKLEIDIHEAPLEVQIISSADGCSHMVGPFMALWWYENSNKPIEELLIDNIKKINKDWNHKIVLPEAREVFQKHHEVLLQQAGDLPESFLS